MKALILLLLAITGIIIDSMCIQQITPSSKTVKLVLTIDEWSSGFFPPEETPEIKSLIMDVREGEEFGPANFTAAPNNKPFKLLKIIDEDHIRIRFDESLVVVGEPVSDPSQQNPIIVSIEKICFRTRSSDCGTDICLKIEK